MRDWISDRFGRGRAITREAVVQTPLRLDLRTANGHVSIRGVEGSSARVRAEIELKGFQRDDGGPAEATVADGIAFEGDSLRIDSPPAARDSIRVHYEVSVPFATLAVLTVMNGAVAVRGIEGPLEITLTNGPLDIEEIGGAVDVQLTQRSGTSGALPQHRRSEGVEWADTYRGRCRAGGREGQQRSD